MRTEQEIKLRIEELTERMRGMQFCEDLDRLSAECSALGWVLGEEIEES